MRTGLMKLNANEHIIIVDTHHIITDGVSSEILDRDLILLYSGKELPPLKLRYKDFSEWQNSAGQKELLKKIKAMIPSRMKVLLAADRFYGTSSLISLCQSFGWQYRIRLKGNLILYHQGGEMQTGELASLGLKGVEEAELNESGVKTCIGVLMEEGHDEPWIIAMDCKPSTGRVLDYGMRWGIEALFSDFKTRGFGITKTQLKDPKRIERLILVLTVACYWAASTGMHPEPVKKQPSKKKRRGA